MLGNDYKNRHNEILRIIHLHYAIKYGFKTSKKLKTHNTSKILENKNAQIKSDCYIHTDTKIKENKPDLYIHDKKTNKITIIEIGITSFDNLNKVENEKYRKYDLLAKELEIMNKCEVELIAVVITWDGFVSKWFNKHINKIKLDKSVQSYMQSTILKKTLESICFDFKRSRPFKGIKKTYLMEEAVEKFSEEQNKLEEEFKC